MMMNPAKPEVEDRLTVLPDDLLHHLFSFLDPLHVFEASLLSRRWRRLFSSTPVLSFSYATFCNRFGRIGSDTRFVGFVEACLKARDDRIPLHALVYDADDSRVEPDKIEALVCKAARLGVQRLQLTGDMVNLRLPACLYASRSLKELTLRSGYIRLSNELGFPALTKLHLELVHFSDTKLNSDIISRCPNLETLILSHCNIDDGTKRFKITAPKLTKLVISYAFDLWYIPSDCEFIINAPRLASFCYSGIKALNCSLSSSHSLDEVEIDVFKGKEELLYGGLKMDDKIDKVAGLVRMINVFKFARTIKVTQPTKECLSQAYGLGLLHMEEDCDDGRLKEILQCITEQVNS